ncbi:MAG TPA: MEDS domain-containing protein [Kineosporiaceae bacterium]|nr:MEDS domain-containing protein [Kineosporiaceae bacterium]
MSNSLTLPAADTRVRPEDSPLEPVGRALGVPALGEAPWGSHFCVFFASPEDLLEILVPHFRAGLENNELCGLSALGQLDLDSVLETFAREIDGFERRMAAGQMNVLNYPPPRADSGLPDCPKILNGIMNRVRDARDQGYTGYRGVGIASWLERSDWPPYMTYEADLTRAVSGERGLVTCGYLLPKCDASQLVDVLMTHQFALLRHDQWTLIEPSERKRATEAVVRMNVALAERTAELQSALADLNGFSRWVTHDLRAPITSITSVTELLAQAANARLDDDEQVMLERIRSSAGWMEDLIGKVEAYSRAQHAQLRLQRLDLRGLVAQVWPAVAGADPSRRMGVRVDDLPAAYGDRGLVSQVLEALLRNAFTATAHRPDPLVHVGATSTDEGGVAYFVRDNGVGFDMAHCDAIFDAFTRLRSVGESAGAGLGLAMVKEIVGRHGGRVWAHSEPGTGATFFFTLPPPHP